MKFGEREETEEALSSCMIVHSTRIKEGREMESSPPPVRAQREKLDASNKKKQIVKNVSCLLCPTIRLAFFAFL